MKDFNVYLSNIFSLGENLVSISIFPKSQKKFNFIILNKLKNNMV